MLKKINFALAIIALCSTLFVGGVAIYTHVSDLSNSKVVQKLEG